MSDPRVENPYDILELDGVATSADVERQKNRLLALLKAGAAKAKVYGSPSGQAPRDEDLVRRAAHALATKEERHWFGLWAHVARRSSAEMIEAPHEPSASAENSALDALAWW